MSFEDHEAELAEFVGRVQDLLNEGQTDEARTLADSRPEFASDLEYLFKGDDLIDQLLTVNPGEDSGLKAPEPRLDLKQFSIQERLPDTGLGSVYSLRMPEGESPRELVVIRSWFTPTQRERILRVARSMRSIRIRGVLPILETGRLNQVPFIERGASSEIELESLAQSLMAGGGDLNIIDALSRVPVPIAAEVTGNLAATKLAKDRKHVQATVALVAQVAGILGRLHAAGRVHLELTPTRIGLEPDGAPRIQGLGLSWIRTEVPFERMRSFEVNYFAPEVFAPIGRPVTWKADIYSLGCILARLFSLQRPHSKETAKEVRSSLLGGLGSYIDALPPGLPPALIQCLREATAFDPEARPPTMEDLADRLLHSVKLRPSPSWLEPQSRSFWSGITRRT